MKTFFNLLFGLLLKQKGPNTDQKIFAGPLPLAVMTGAFLLPALSPRDGIPAVRAGSNYAALLLHIEMRSPLMFSFSCSHLTLLYSCLTVPL